MKKFWIYYRKNPTFRPYGQFDNEKEPWQAICGDIHQDSEVAVNPAIYQFVAFQWGENKDEIFHTMQGEIWSPNGEARPLIRGLKLQHTSMSVGDIVVEEGGNVYEVLPCGWKTILKDGFPV